MKILPAILSLLVLAALPAARADFVMVQKIEGMGQNLEITTKFKGSKTRIDMAPATSMIVDLKSGEMMTLLHPQKSYTKISGPAAQTALQNLHRPQPDAIPSPAPDAKPPLTPTGKKDTIAGYAAEEYTGTFHGVKMNFWLTRDLPDYQTALRQLAAAAKQGPLAAQSARMGLDLENLPGFPVRSVIELGGGQTLTSTTISISTKPLPDSDFEAPADYHEMKGLTLPPTLTPPAAPPSLTPPPQPTAR